MIDRFGADFDDMVPDLCFIACDDRNDESDPNGYGKVSPAQHKDIFEKPVSFDKAWNHEEPFQRAKWREAIGKEFKKMEERKVWKKIKRSSIPGNRRCVKHKWVFEVK